MSDPATRPGGDLLVAAGTLAFIVAVDYDDGLGRLWLFDLAPVVPLLWRRRFPFAVFLTTAAIALLQWALDIQAAGAVCVLVALCAVGAHAGHRWQVQLGVGVAVAEFGVLLVALRWAPHGGGLTTFLLLSGTVTAAWVLGLYLRTRRAYISGVLERAATAERERDHRALLATMAERARISAEMHDIVAHSLSVMIALNDGAAVAVTRAPEDAVAGLRQASALGRQAMTELRRLLDDEDTGLAPLPGVHDIDALVDRVRAAGLAVRLIVLGRRPELSPAVELTVFRLVQEALTNALKHAPAGAAAQVTLHYHPVAIDLEISNDAAVAAGISAGRGLTGMRQRAATLGGTVEAGPQPDGTWRVRATLHLGGPGR